LIEEENCIPGKILNISKNSFKIGTGDGVILVKKFSYNKKTFNNLIEMFSKNNSNLLLGQ
jgi:methionyl-tRNA formyltransferase